MIEPTTNQKSNEERISELESKVELMEAVISDLLPQESRIIDGRIFMPLRK